MIKNFFKVILFFLAVVITPALAQQGQAVGPVNTLGVATATSFDTPLLKMAGGYQFQQTYCLISANFNSTADQLITVALPTGYVHYRLGNIIISNPSTSLTTAAGGFYTALSKGGTAVIAAGQVYSALTTNTVGANGSLLLLNPVNVNTAYYNSTTLYLSLTTSQGSAATADVCVVINALP